MQIRKTETALTRAHAEEIAADWCARWGWGYGGSATVACIGLNGYAVYCSRFSSCD